MKLSLTIKSGSLAGNTYELETGFLTIGRGENCSVRLDPVSERIASKQHAFIEARRDGFYLTDHKSTNGTYVNGSKIESVKLNSGDQIQLGTEGVIAGVSILSASGAEPVERESFRRAQLEEFSSVATGSPENFRNSISNIGLGNMAVAIERPEEKRSAFKTIAAAVTILTIVFLSIVVFALFAVVLSTGPTDAFQITSDGVFTAVLATVVAFIPALLYVLPLMWLDRYDPEPLWLLALTFAWGALIAILISFFINTGVDIGVARAVGGIEGAILGDIVGAVISAPVVEEASKGVGLLLLLIFFRRYFDDVLDGIVFGGVIALGFATVENVLYYGRAISDGGLAGLITLFVLRGVLSPFAHVTFTAMTGIGCGIARESHNGFVRIVMPILGYILAVLLHALWNGMAVFGGFDGFLAGYLIIQIPFFILFVTGSLLIMWRQNKILKEMLAIDIARGLIPQEHAKKATSAFLSTFWLLAGMFQGKYRARRKYTRAIGKLGLSYWHIQRANAAKGQTGSFQQNPVLRDEVLAWRDKVD
jgi:protease PrsW